jgi:D-alanyl-lipoteichoic acid acyltransferase DltB (MBOAT superfamily)
MVTMLLGGLWHGAGWNFVLWGLYHGALLSAHRALAPVSQHFRTGFQPVKIAFTFFCVSLGWVLFRAQSAADARLIFQRLFSPTDGQMYGSAEVAIAVAAWIAVIGAHIFSSHVEIAAALRRLPAPIVATGMAAVFLLVQVLMPHRGGAFIYFQF